MESTLSRTFLICAYPRSRTLWLSRFFSIPRVCACSHEASEYASSSEEFWDNAELYSQHSDCPIYGNSDSAQIFILPALLALKPTTKVIWIERPMPEVIASMSRAKLNSTPEKWVRSLLSYRARYQDLFDSVIPYEDLNRVETIQALWTELFGPEVPFVEEWWQRMKDQRITYSVPDNPPPTRNNERFTQFLMHEMERLTWPTQQSSEL